MYRCRSVGHFHVGLGCRARAPSLGLLLLLSLLVVVCLGKGSLPAPAPSTSSSAYATPRLLLPRDDTGPDCWPGEGGALWPDSLRRSCIPRALMSHSIIYFESPAPPSCVRGSVRVCVCVHACCRPAEEKGPCCFHARRGHPSAGTTTLCSFLFFFSRARGGATTIFLLHPTTPTLLRFRANF